MDFAGVTGGEQVLPVPLGWYSLEVPRISLKITFVLEKWPYLAFEAKNEKVLYFLLIQEYDLLPDTLHTFAQAYQKINLIGPQM